MFFLGITQTHTWWLVSREMQSFLHNQFIFLFFLNLKLVDRCPSPLPSGQSTLDTSFCLNILSIWDKSYCRGALIQKYIWMRVRVHVETAGRRIFWHGPAELRTASLFGLFVKIIRRNNTSQASFRVDNPDGELNGNPLCWIKWKPFSCQPEL